MGIAQDLVIDPNRSNLHQGFYYMGFLYMVPGGSLGGRPLAWGPWGFPWGSPGVPGGVPWGPWGSRWGPPAPPPIYIYIYIYIFMAGSAPPHHCVVSSTTLVSVWEVAPHHCVVRITTPLCGAQHHTTVREVAHCVGGSTLCGK